MSFSSMKVSHYAKAYPHEEGYLVLFSLRTTAVVLVEEEVWERALSGTLSPEEEEALREQGFVVRDNEEEKREVYTLLERRNAANPELGILSVMNLDCNLSCVYCFEGALKGRHYMDEGTAEPLLAFIDGWLTPEKKALKIDFYGGEPLLSLGLIKHLSRKARELAERKGTEYRCSLVTNGTLLTKKAVDELVPLGLESVKITLDGPRENHDAHRPFKGGGGSFDAIVRNIKDACGKIKIAIGGNFSRKNYGQFPGLLDYLLAEGLTPEVISSVKFDPISFSDNQPPVPDFRDVCMSINEPWLLDASLRLGEEILRRGFHTPATGPAACSTYNRSHFVVNYDGSLYKCPGFLGKPEFRIGNLWGEIPDYSGSHNLDSWRNPECMECEYLPFCFGGCRYSKFLEVGNVSGVDCLREYLEATLESSIKQDIKYRYDLETV